MFRVGDEVVCVNAEDFPPPPGLQFRPPVMGRLIEGQIYTVAAVFEVFGEAGVRLRNVEAQVGYLACRFRKVQRRDLTAWVNQSVGNTDKLDKRQTKKVRA